MTALARKLAMMRAAVQEIRKNEVELAKGSILWRRTQELRAIIDAAQKAQEWAGEAMALVQDIKRKSEGYLRGM